MSKLFFTKAAILLTLFTLFSLTASAQNTTVAQNTNNTQTETVKTDASDETQAKVKQLEDQLKQMQAQLEALQRIVNQNQAQTTVKPTENVAVKTTEMKATETATKTENKPQQQQKTLGVDIGSARLTPYGTIYFNAFGNSGGTNNSDVPLFATTTGADNVSASVRQTRLGLKLDGAKVGDARLSAILEADFFGGFPSTTVGENFGIVR